MEDSSSERSLEIFMNGCRRRLSLSTDTLKIATVTIYIVLVLHIVGFVLPNWYEIVLHQTIVGSKTIETETYIVGLWKDCLCNYVIEANECKCETKFGFTGFLKRVQILESVGLGGFIISAIVCLILLFLRQHDRLLKGCNFLVATCSGVCATAGVILFERENVGLEYKDAFTYIVSISPDESEYRSPEVRSNLTTSFILCTVAAGLSLFCIPLFVIDLSNRDPPALEEMRLIHMEHIIEGPFTIRHVHPQNS